MPLAFASAAGAQTAEGQAAIAGGAPLPPEFVLYSDGSITIGGDVGTDCYTFAVTNYPQTTRGPLRDAAQAVLDQCQRLGLPRGHSDPFNAEVILSIDAIVPPGAYAGTGVLPDTGGFPFALIGALAGGLALGGFGGLMLKRSLDYR